MTQQQTVPIKRYYHGTDRMQETASGDWVRYDDHVAALASAHAAHQPDQEASWEAMRHAGNEWADMAINGLQWVRNIHDNISTTRQALANLEANLRHCREVQACAGIKQKRP